MSGRILECFLLASLPGVIVHNNAFLLLCYEQVDLNTSQVFERDLEKCKGKRVTALGLAFQLCGR